MAYGLEEFGPPTSLSNDIPRETVNVENVRKALEELRFDAAYLKKPSLEEVAYGIELIPELVKPFF